MWVNQLLQRIKPSSVVCYRRATHLADDLHRNFLASGKTQLEYLLRVRPVVEAWWREITRT